MLTEGLDKQLPYLLIIKHIFHVIKHGKIMNIFGGLLKCVHLITNWYSTILKLLFRNQKEF